MTETDRQPKILNARLRSTLITVVQGNVERVNYTYVSKRTKRSVDESIYQLHERGIIALHADGTISVTDKGQWHVHYVQSLGENINADHCGRA